MLRYQGGDSNLSSPLIMAPKTWWSFNMRFSQLAYVLISPMIWCCLSAASSWLRLRGLLLPEIALTVARSSSPLLSKPNPCRYRAAGWQAGRCALSADKRKDKGQVVQERRTRLAPHIAGHLSRRATKRNNRKLLLQLATTSAPTTGSSSSSFSSMSSDSGTTTRVESEPPTDRFTLSSLPVSARDLSLSLLDLASFSDAITPD